LEAALRQLTSGVERDASLWTRGRLGRWTAGQQIAHVGLAIALMAEPFEVAVQASGAGAPPPVPRRGLLQSMFVEVVVDRGFMPTGARAVAPALPPERPEPSATLAALGREAGRLRVVGERMSADERDRLWIWNPIGGIPSRVTTWHY